MAIVRIEGKQISYWIGKGGVIRGREVILFIHGAGGGQYTWNNQKAFFEKEFNPIMIELPGHGESGGEGEEEAGRYAEHVYSFMKALKLWKVFLVGHSMGGAIVQTLALTHSKEIKGIVLVGTGAKLRVLPTILNGIKNNFEGTVRMIARLAYSRKASSELIEQGVSDLMRCQPEVLYGDFLACDRFDMMNELEKVNLPTLVLCGEDDELTSVKYAQFLHQRIKGSKLEIFPHAGHMAMIELPSVFNEKVREFIKAFV
jgi:pimeloyl-ACP methyl ester carboxylesterase